MRDRRSHYIDGWSRWGVLAPVAASAGRWIPPTEEEGLKGRSRKLNFPPRVDDRAPGLHAAMRHAIRASSFRSK